MRWRITRLFRSLVQNTAPKDTRSVFFLFRKVDGEKRERPERTSNSEAFEVLDATLVGSSTRLKRPLAPPRGAAALTAARFDGTSIDPPTGPTTRAYGMARRNHTTRMRGIFIEIRGENRLMPRGIENALERLKFSLPRFPTTIPYHYARDIFRFSFLCVGFGKFANYCYTWIFIRIYEI